MVQGDLFPAVSTIDYYLLRDTQGHVALWAHFPETRRSLVVRGFTTLTEGLVYAALARVELQNCELHTDLTSEKRA